MRKYLEQNLSSITEQSSPRTFIVVNGSQTSDLGQVSPQVVHSLASNQPKLSAVPREIDSLIVGHLQKRRST